MPKLAALDLRGVSVAVDYLVRPKFAAVQGAAHRRFWRRLFAEAGATNVAFIGMPPDEAVAPMDSEQDVSTKVPPTNKQHAKRKGQR